MKIICAWCSKEITVHTSQSEASGFEVSHGICEACREHFFANIQTTLERFLNRLEAPVLMINAEGEVVLANDMALQLLGKELDAVQGKRGGDAMECVYARLPGGCGNTIHCKACTIRNAVMETFNTEKCLDHVPAYLNRADKNSVQRIRFLISTEKLGEVVLLRIDEVHPEAPPVTTG